MPGSDPVISNYTAATTYPAEGWVLDQHALAHQVRERGPSCSVTWCGLSIYGPVVAEITPTTHQCGRCRAAKRRTEAEQYGETVQGRLF